MTETQGSYRRDHLTELDGVRGIAILLVMVAHLGRSRIFAVPVSWGFQGVDLFFFLSGFLITRIRLFEQQQGIGLKAFWIRRVTRIFPAAYLCLFIVSLVWGFSYHILLAGTYLTTFDLSLLATHNDPPIEHFWTLAVEEQFYLLWPLILVFAPRQAVRIAVLGACLFISFFLVHGFIGEALGEGDNLFTLLNRQVFTRGWPLLAGSLIALKEPELRSNPGKLLPIAFLAAAVGLTIAGASLIGRRMPLGVQVLELGVFAKQLLLGSFFLFVLYAAYTKKATPFTNPLLRWVGSVSYGLYLCHLPIYIALDARSPGGHPIFAIVLSFVVAATSFYLFERPIIRWGRAISRREPKKLAVPATLE